MSDHDRPSELACCGTCTHQENERLLELLAHMDAERGRLARELAALRPELVRLRATAPDDNDDVDTRAAASFGASPAGGPAGGAASRGQQGAQQGQQGQQAAAAARLAAVEGELAAERARRQRAEADFAGGAEGEACACRESSWACSAAGPRLPQRWTSPCPGCAPHLSPTLPCFPTLPPPSPELLSSMDLLQSPAHSSCSPSSASPRAGGGMGGIGSAGAASDAAAVGQLQAAVAALRAENEGLRGDLQRSRAGASAAAAASSSLASIAQGLHSIGAGAGSGMTG